MNSESRIQKLPFLGVWELNKSVMLLLGSVMIPVATIVSAVAFLSFTGTVWEAGDLRFFYGFSSFFTAGLLWACAYRVDFIQNFSQRKSARFLAGFVAASLVLAGTFEILAAFGRDFSGIYSTMRYVAVILASAGAFTWAAANRSKPVSEIRNAVSCIVFGILFYTGARFLDTLANVSVQYGLICSITSVHLQTAGTVLAFTGIVLYERFIYSLYQYKISRRFISSADASTDTLDWLMENIGTPPKSAASAETPDETGVPLANLNR